MELEQAADANEMHKTVIKAYESGREDMGIEKSETTSFHLEDCLLKEWKAYDFAPGGKVPPCGTG